MKHIIKSLTSSILLLGALSACTPPPPAHPPLTALQKKQIQEINAMQVRLRNEQMLNYYRGADSE